VLELRDGVRVIVCVVLAVVDIVGVEVVLDEDEFDCLNNMSSSACLELQSSAEQQTPAISLISSTPLLA